MVVRFLKYFLISFVAVFLICYSVFKILNYGLKKNNKDSFGIINYVIKGNEKNDILIIGASVAKNNINPLVIEKRSGLSAFDCAIYANKIVEYKMLLERYIRSGHPLPSTVIVSLQPNTLTAHEKLSFPPRYYAYYDDSLLYNRIAPYDYDLKKIKLFPFIAISKYTDYLRQLGLLGLFSTTYEPENKGFEPLQAGVFSGDEQDAYPGIAYDKEGVQLLSDFCELCRENNIKIIFLYTPVLQWRERRANYNEVMNTLTGLLRPLIEKYQVSILDYSQHDICFEKELYYQNIHFNEKGANLFSQILADDLTKQLKEGIKK